MVSEHSSTLFALDIGTRSVVGLLLKPTDDQFELIDSVIKEHEERAMHDGQIHDIQSVAKTIHEVKVQLEERHGPLNKVCVAAAGRSLKTRKAHMEIDITGKPLFNHDDVLHLELSAVQQAQFQLANEPVEDTLIDYYCVGYSVLDYSLDHEPIGSLIDQKGKRAAVQVIATFLPSVVIESLLAALSRADLELDALTLEPIAAINVLIPRSMRRLNVALVDIGAGTSDIALTDEGTVTAYGMVPIAGDEITEALSDHFLLDFPEAEKIKRLISIENTVEMTDILGISTNYTKEEVISPLEESINKLARTISNEIMTLNGKAPKAVMLVGGGSLTPNLPIQLASFLGLPENRVAIRDADAIKQLKKEEMEHYGPELVTPIGIAISAKEHSIKSIRIDVNGQPIRLFDVKKLTVGDGLLAAGVNIAKLYGKPGLALMVTVQERLVSIPGGHGKPPLLLKNGTETTLDEPLQHNDQLIVEQGAHGKQAMITIAELLGDIPSLTLFINSKQVELPLTILRNGQPASPNEQVDERDWITINETKTVRDALIAQNLTPTSFEALRFFVNGERWSYDPRHASVFVNGQQAAIDQSLKNHDRIEWEAKESDEGYTLEEILQSKRIQINTSINVYYNEEEITLKKKTIEVKRENEILSLQDIIKKDDHLILKTIQVEPFILQDIFSIVDIDLSNATGKKVVLKRNGEKTSFASSIFNGDKIELHLD